MSSGLLGVEGGLILDGDPVPSRLSFRMSGSLKLRRSEFCRKKMGLESNWKWRRRNTSHHITSRTFASLLTLSWW